MRMACSDDASGWLQFACDLHFPMSFGWRQTSKDHQPPGSPWLTKCSTASKGRQTLALKPSASGHAKQVFMRSTPCLRWRVSRQAICAAQVSRLPESLQNAAKPKSILCQGRRRKLKPESVSAPVHDSSASLAYFRAAKLAPHNVSYTLTPHTKISPRKLNQRRDSSTTCLKRCCREIGRAHV